MTRLIADEAARRSLGLALTRHKLDLLTVRALALAFACLPGLRSLLSTFARPLGTWYLALRTQSSKSRAAVNVREALCMAAMATIISPLSDSGTEDVPSTRPSWIAGRGSEDSGSQLQDDTVSQDDSSPHPPCSSLSPGNSTGQPSL